MILIWLGSFALMLFGFEMSQKKWQALLRFRSRNPLLRILAAASPQRSLYEGAVGMNSGRLGSKPGLTMMAFDFLGAWWIFLLSGLFLNIQGLLFAGIGSLMFLNLRRFDKLQKLFQLSFATGLFLIGGEFLLRQSAMLQSILGESNFAFWLVDGRGLAVLSLLIAGMLLGLLVRLQFWSLILGFCLLISSTISFSGALALFAGELLAQSLWLYYRGQDFSPVVRRIVRQWSMVSAAGALSGFFVALYLKELLNWGSSFGMNGSQERYTQFLVLAAAMILIQGFIQMLAGHFLSRSVPNRDFPQSPIPPWWFESGILARDEGF